MMLETKYGTFLNGRLVGNYFSNLIDLFFKILPLRENNEDTLPIYMKGLQAELLGCHELILATHDDANFLSLLSNLQYMIDHSDEPVGNYKRYVFKSISICKRLATKFAEGGDGE